MLNWTSLLPHMDDILLAMVLTETPIAKQDERTGTKEVNLLGGN